MFSERRATYPPPPSSVVPARRLSCRTVCTNSPHSVSTSQPSKRSPHPILRYRRNLSSSSIAESYLSASIAKGREPPPCSSASPTASTPPSAPPTSPPSTPSRSISRTAPPPHRSRRPRRRRHRRHASSV